MRIYSVSKTRLLGRAICVAAAVVAVAAASAGPTLAAEPQSQTVRFGDLNPHQPADAAKLLRRIEYAAGVVCGDSNIPDLTQRAVQRRCYAVAVDRAVRDVDLPMVTALAQRSAPPVTVAGE